MASPASPPLRTRLALGVALSAGAAASALVLAATRDLALAAGFGGTALVIGGAVLIARLLPRRAPPPVVERDWSVARALAALGPHPTAITDAGGRLVCADDRYLALFPDAPTPPNLPVGDAGAASLADAARAAWREGEGVASGLVTPAGLLTARVTRAGAEEDALVWRFEAPAAQSAQIEAELDGPLGVRLGAAGVMAALIAPDGRLRAANRVFRRRALGQDEALIAGRDFAALLAEDGQGGWRLAREGAGAPSLRLLHLPTGDGEEAPIVIALIDEEPARVLPVGAALDVETLVDVMPFGLALVDREGRLMRMNEAFARATAVDPAAPPLYPGDLVVREDKGALADAVRRFASGASHSADMAVRLRDRPEEPVALTLAGARGLGKAAVLLALKDSGEESRLKREVEQATKMRAVGQLAGGVAHDFNNIITAIIGHCDLMLMRHTPGDSDYDDIQQIRLNSNRAASLTRQLLAFSRQQTLRPQILQLPDVISEVSYLLKRLLGETVTLDVRHGRDLGAVRADPGQLEQVVMNLAVNARDAMLAKNPQGGGTLTIQTLSVSAAEVERMESDILPAGDYTALRVSDTGTGIPPDVLPKIWEPFFTTKDVGKGTGLGLSTVYGIVKQSGGYIFADSKPGQGATFTLYLPVHRGGGPARSQAPVKAKPAELWGTGSILIVEDEDMVRAVAERALTRQGYTVATAENGEVALDMLATLPRPDLLVSDVVMPTMDGPTMVRAARARYPDLPILFMSGYAEEQLRRSIDLDNVAFLPKPFSVQQLAEAVRAVLAAK